jgi:SAM-dependent methyltransferase
MTPHRTVSTPAWTHVRVVNAGLVCALAFAMDVAAAVAQTPASRPVQPLDVIYVPTPAAVVSYMLTAAKVGRGDVVIDLGSGDGRIPIAAVRDFGAARGIGIELDPLRIAEARANAVAAGVSDRVEFLEQDLFAANLSDATVIAMYLLPAMNVRLQPKLRALRPGTRIVSHNYDMGAAWKPSKTQVVENSLVHFWTVPRR